MTIKEILKNKGKSVKELADQLHIHPNSLSRIINGAPTKKSTLESIAKELGVSVDDLTNEPNNILRLLDSDEMRIVKIITIVAPTPYGKQEIGYFMYERPLTANYKFTESEAPSSFVEDYPRQRDYPHDELDKMILRIIQTEYPESKLQNKFVSFNLDLEHIKQLQDRPSKELKIWLTPNPTEIESGRTYYKYEKIFNFYTNFSESLVRQLFVSSYSLAQEKRMNEQLNTMTAL